MADILDAHRPGGRDRQAGEPLPELGAARLYVGDDQWQAKVQRADAARPVWSVVRLGASPGLLWEIEQALAHLPRQRAGPGGARRLGGRASARRASWRTTLGPTFDGSAAAAATRRAGAGDVLRDPAPAHRRPGLLRRATAAPTRLPVRRWPPQWRGSRLLCMLRSVARPAATRLARGVRAGSASASWTTSGRSRAAGGARWRCVRLDRRALVLPRHSAGAASYVLDDPAPDRRRIFLGFFDALRFLWVDRAEFDARFSALPSALGTRVGWPRRGPYDA